jgi:hypothetical protein
VSCTSPPNVLSIAERLYRIMLFVYPATHRCEYGPLMIQAFRDLCCDSYRREGVLGLVGTCIHVLTDMAVTATIEHLYILNEGDQLMTKKQHLMTILSAGFPLGLWLSLLLLNPAFAIRMVIYNHSPAQPVGWMMTSAIFILVGIAYVAQRKGYVLTHQSGSSSWALSRTTLRSMIFVGSIVLFILPATFLVLFGPAIVMVLDAGF